MATLIRIGYWRSDNDPDWPDPSAFLDPEWDDDERHMVGTFLLSGTIVRAYMGVAPCRLCGNSNGSVEYSDGTYVWPEGLAHYVEAHDVRPPSAFVMHAVARLEELEGAAVDDEWWKSQDHA